MARGRTISEFTFQRISVRLGYGVEIGRHNWAEVWWRLTSHAKRYGWMRTLWHLVAGR